jgi:hypothetical protein
LILDHIADKCRLREPLLAPDVVTWVERRESARGWEVAERGRRNGSTCSSHHAGIYDGKVNSSCIHAGGRE